MWSKCEFLGLSFSGWQNGTALQILMSRSKVDAYNMLQTFTNPHVCFQKTNSTLSFRGYSNAEHVTLDIFSFGLLCIYKTRLSANWQIVINLMYSFMIC